MKGMKVIFFQDPFAIERKPRSDRTMVPSPLRHAFTEASHAQGAHRVTKEGFKERSAASGSAAETPPEPRTFSQCGLGSPAGWIEYGHHHTVSVSLIHVDRQTIVEDSCWFRVKSYFKS